MSLRDKLTEARNRPEFSIALIKIDILQLIDERLSDDYHITDDHFNDIEDGLDYILDQYEVKRFNVES